MHDTIKQLCLNDNENLKIDFNQHEFVKKMKPAKQEDSIN